MRLIDKNEALKCSVMDTEIYNAINMLPTVDAIPISFIEKRIEQLKSHAGGSQYRLWELECLLDVWATRKE